MRKINILHIIEQLPLGGGAENLLWTLGRNISRNKFNLIFCCLNNDGYIVDRLKDKGFKVVFFGHYRLRHFHKKIIDVMRLIRTEKVDIVHTHLLLANKWGRMFALLSNQPKICKSEHATFLEFWKNGTTRSRRLYLILDDILDRFTDCIICVSNAQREIMTGRKSNPDKYVVIHNAFDEKRFLINNDKTSIRNTYGFSDQDIVIGTVGRLFFSKGHNIFLKAVKEISETYLEIKVLIIGNGPEEAKLKKLAETLGLEVLFLSNRDDVPQLMRAMDIYVQSSFHEAFGITIAEAMFSGLPVVATNVGGIPEVVKDGETGILVPPRDSKALSKAITTLIENPEMAKSMGEKGRAVAASKFTGERYARDMEKLYASLME